MGPDLEKAIQAISLRMRLLKAMQEDNPAEDNLTEREYMILELVKQHGSMTVSQISAADQTVSDSTISTTITKLWRDKQMVSKVIDPRNQRSTIIALTEKGTNVLELFQSQRAERFKTLFEAIDVTDEEKDVFLRVLTRSITYFDKFLGEKKESEQ